MAILGENGELLAEHYPANWDEFVGQDGAKRALKIAARSAKARGKSMSHVLLSSPVPGIGKTSLALLAALEMSKHIRVQSGPVTPAELPYLFMDLEEGDVLFLDEVHRLAQGGKGKAEWLLHLLENGVVTTALGMIEVPPITVIAATTDAGRLPETILDRFDVRPDLVPYTDQEGATIALQLARKVLESDGLALPTAPVCEAIARAGNNNPRLMRRVLCRLRDAVWADEVPEAEGDYSLQLALEFAGVTADGLPSQAQRYLRVLWVEFRGAPAGAKVMGDRLGEVGQGLGMVERLLIDKGLIQLTKGGRMLTPNGLRRARELAA